MEVYRDEVNMQREDIKMLVKKWWDVYDDSSLDFKAEDTTKEGTISKSSILASSLEPAVSYIPAPFAA
ncbi:galactinol synthase 1 [Olea europaea subsp. europaea]|uniref:Galactinol synthase 1 n=1 Tax=Olea europaea subsp. europaea TaxID=158383 RepID=A0A8S0PXL1_OLEEU|nr:galactinol synthase 1 [Olea europaea subsp. europaea]